MVSRVLTGTSYPANRIMHHHLVVAVCGYQGDANQIDNLWPAHVQHNAPIIILSPEDSPVFKTGVICCAAGKRAYIGPESLERQFIHLNVLKAIHADWYLVNDADSCLLSPGLPDYIFSRPDVLWSNKVPDDIHVRPANYPLPRFALQPPYVFSRNVLDRLLSKGQFPIDDQSKYGRYGDTKWVQTPYIDWFMMALAHYTGVYTLGFLDGASCPTSECPVGSSIPGARHSGCTIMLDLVRTKGIRFCHSIKEASVFADLCKARTEYLTGRP
jgi:hypothetical protein